MEIETVPEGSVQVETVTVDTAAEAETTTTAAGNDITKVTRMTIHAANEGISLLDYGIGLLGGSLFALRLSLQHSRVSGVHRLTISAFSPSDPGKLVGQYPFWHIIFRLSLRTSSPWIISSSFRPVCEVISSKFAFFPQTGNGTGG